MAVMKWGTPPSGNQDDNRAHVVGHGEGVALQHAAFGTKVEGGGQINTLGPNVELAYKYSGAPYTGPDVDVAEQDERPNVWGYRSPKRAKKCMANGDTCKAWATKSSNYEYCHPHHRLAEGKPAWSPNEKAE
jgi:hypothetical protein